MNNSDEPPGPGDGPPGDPTRAADPRPVGIGGCLILPAIGLVLGSVVGAVALVADVGACLEAAGTGYAGLFALELLADAVLVALTVHAATRFFGKRRDAPAAFIALLVANVAASGLLLVVEHAEGVVPLAEESRKQLVRGIVSAAVWIPYFRSSKRVRATFVN